jgi:hypothetical protein
MSTSILPCKKDKEGVETRTVPPARANEAHSILYMSYTPCTYRENIPFAQIIRKADKVKQTTTRNSIPPVSSFLVFFLLFVGRGDQAFFGGSTEIIQDLIVVYYQLSLLSYSETRSTYHYR